MPMLKNNPFFLVRLMCKRRGAVTGKPGLSLISQQCKNYTWSFRPLVACFFSGKVWAKLHECNQAFVGISVLLIFPNVLNLVHKICMSQMHLDIFKTQRKWIPHQWNPFINVLTFSKDYHKVASSNLSPLESDSGFFRLLMKGIFDLYVLWAFDKKLISN